MSTSMMHEFMVVVGMESAIKAKVEALMSSTTLPHLLGIVHHVDEVNHLHGGGGDGKCN